LGLRIFALVHIGKNRARFRAGIVNTEMDRAPDCEPPSAICFGDEAFASAGRDLEAKSNQEVIPDNAWRRYFTYKFFGNPDASSQVSSASDKKARQHKSRCWVDAK